MWLSRATPADIVCSLLREVAMIRVCVVDDDAVTRNTIGRLLEFAGYRVVVYEDSQPALDKEGRFDRVDVQKGDSPSSSHQFQSQKSYRCIAHQPGVLGPDSGNGRTHIQNGRSTIAPTNNGKAVEWIQLHLFRHPKPS